MRLLAPYAYLGESIAISSQDKKVLVGAPGLKVKNRNVGGVFSVSLEGPAQERVVEPLLLQDNLKADYGQTLVLADLNGDGLDDLIVAAPDHGPIQHPDFLAGHFYTKQYEGRLFIYLGTAQGVS